MDTLDYLAKIYDNVVLYAEDGTPSIFVKFPKMKSKDLDDSLPDHTHPAFIINGVEQDYILLGKYKTCETENKKLCSLPSLPPKVELSDTTALERMRAFIPAKTSGMTIADAGLLLLLCQKHGWNAQRGNTLYGIDYRDGESWTAGKEVTTGQIFAFDGWQYKCLKNHKTTAELPPDKAPGLWEKGKFIGGVCASKEKYGGIGPVCMHTYNGSGPLDWYMGSQAGNMCDLCGSAGEINYGLRLVDYEIQILENNNAAAPGADLSENSSQWKAILPNSGNDGYTLVAPKTPGTLHWNLSKEKNDFTLDTQKGDDGFGKFYLKAFQYIEKAPALNHVPSIVKELGIFPTDGSLMDGTVDFWPMSDDNGRHSFARGGSNNKMINNGLGTLECVPTNAISINNVSFRQRALYTK